jgi:hypothetical protein
MLLHNVEQLRTFKPKSGLTITHRNEEMSEPQLKGLKIKGKINTNSFKKAQKIIKQRRKVKPRTQDRSVKSNVETKIVPSNIEHNIYNALFQEKKLTEFYIGSIPFQWNYTIAHYTAELTEAVDFTLFDKVICGILQLDEVASLEEIGTILGMNVVDNPDEKRYLDPAEKEILVEALQLLESYQMIEVGDSYYSRCRLTNTGKEYAQKGRKFKVTNDVPFTLYFDNFSEQHQTAHQRFKNLTSERNAFEQNFDLLDEDLMREIAAIQTPEIYNPNPEKLRSFRYAKLDESRTQTYATQVYACLLVDVETRNYRIEVYLPQHDKIDADFSNSLDKILDFKEDLMLQFISRFNCPFELEDKVINHQNYLIKNQIKVGELLENKELEKAQIFVKNTYSQADFIDTTYFINNIKNFINKEQQEVWLIFSEVDKTILDNLNNLLGTFDLPLETNLFIIIPNDIELENKKLNVWIFNRVVT